MICFTSNLHFYHEKIITMTGRSFSDAEEMNEVYILGNLTMKGAAQAEEILRQLSGRKYLIRGNHDRFADKADFNHSLFQWVKGYHVLRYEGERFVLFHYPIEKWDQFFCGAYHLHGHRHSGPEVNLLVREQGLRQYDVGVDANGSLQ